MATATDDRDVLHGVTRLRMRLLSIEAALRLTERRLATAAETLNRFGFHGADHSVDGAKASLAEAGEQLGSLLGDLPAAAEEGGF